MIDTIKHTMTFTDDQDVERNKFLVIILALLMLNTLDVGFTSIILHFGGVEANPITNAFIQKWGMLSVFLLKLVIVGFLTTCILHMFKDWQRHHAKVFKRTKALLALATFIYLGVIVYSGGLLFTIWAIN